jgi:hypothetical protein
MRSIKDALLTELETIKALAEESALTADRRSKAHNLRSIYSAAERAFATLSTPAPGREKLSELVDDLLQASYEFDRSTGVEAKPLYEALKAARLALEIAADTAILSALPAVPEPRWPKPLAIRRHKKNDWHGDVSFARRPTDAELLALYDYLRGQDSFSSEPVVDEVAPVVVVHYTNWRGETSRRRIIPKSVRYGSTEWHPEPQWLLLAWDDDKQADREFALKDFGIRGGAVNG